MNTARKPVKKAKTAPKKPAPKRAQPKGQGNSVVVGQPLHYRTDNHPPRVNSPEYNATRKWLMNKAAGGCFICGGPVDLSHPGAPANAKGLQDHHGGGLYHNLILVGFNLFPLEWATGWGANPAKVQDFVNQLNAAGLCSYKEPIKTVADVMDWVDSEFNANVKLCAPHHVGLQTQHTPDANGHEAVGIHNAPWPVLAAQSTCDWENFNMFAGTTGTLAVAPDPTREGAVIVTYVHESHPETVAYAPSAAAAAAGAQPTFGKLQVGASLDRTHPSAIAAFQGYRTNPATRAFMANVISSGKTKR
jgi:hypothetical protein